MYLTYSLVEDSNADLGVNFKIVQNRAIAGAHYTFHKKLVELAKFLKTRDFKGTFQKKI